MEKGFKGITTTYKSGIPDFPASRYTGSDIRVRDDSMNCAHVAIALDGPGYNNPDFVAMEIASSVSLVSPFELSSLLILFSLLTSCWAIGILPVVAMFPVI